MNQLELLQQGVAHLQAGRADEAERLFGEILQGDPTQGYANSMMGTLRLQQDRAAEALPFFAAALTRLSDPGTLVNYGLALDRAGRREEALSAFDQALGLNPGLFAAHYNRGNALFGLERHDDAAAAFGQALALDPGFAGARQNRAEALRRLGRLPEALADLDWLVSLQPGGSDALFSRACVLRDLGRRDASLADFERLAALQPDNAGAQLGRAALLFEMRRMREALAGFQAFARLRPGDPQAVGGIAAAAGAICDWDSFAAIETQLDACIRQGSRCLPVNDLLGMRDDPVLLLKAAQNAFAELVAVPPPPLWQGTPYRHERIRLTYVSTDFRQHALALLLTGLIERHDRARFEVTAIAMGPDDGSAVRARLAAAFDRFIPLPGFEPEKAARLVRELETDIAIDCNGQSPNSLQRLFSHRPAPVQVNYLGTPGTMGADCWDYALADATALPFSDQPFFSEKIVHLPDCYQANAARPLGETPTRAEAGLPENGFVFACFNYGWKIKPPVFDVWMRLLRAVPQSVLWLLEVDDDTSANLKAQAARRGVEPARLVFAPNLPLEQHLARHRLAGLFLDTLCYNAHTTGSDALWVGLPLITCPGRSFASRVGASLLRAAGLPELVTASLDDYEALALALARDPARLESLRRRLVENRDRCALFDFDGHRRAIEAAFVRMWEIAQAGGAPQSFAVAGPRR